MTMIQLIACIGMIAGLFIIRLRGEQESDVFSYLSRIEQNINDIFISPKNRNSAPPQ